MSITSQVNVTQGETKLLKTIEVQREYRTEPMEIEKLEKKQEAQIEIPPKQN